MGATQTKVSEEIILYGPQQATVEGWLDSSGVYKGGRPITREEILKILKAYRAYIYEVEVRPEISFTGQETPF